MPRQTLGEARKLEHGICGDLGFCSDDDRVRHAINQAQWELADKGRWWGTYQEIKVYVRLGTVVWPRQVANIEVMNVCCEPAPIRNQWYEYLELGCGQNLCCGSLFSSDRGTTCAFDDIVGSGKVIRTYPTHIADVGKKIRYQGYDQNEIWIRSVIDGVMQDGVEIVLAFPFVDTVPEFKALVAVQKEETVERVLVYEHNVADDLDKAIAIYEPSETHPVYRKSYVASLSGCCDTQIKAITKLEFIPAKLDSDWLLIGNLPALRKMSNSIQARKNNNDLQATLLMKEAVKNLNDELRTHTGDRVAVNVNVQGTSNMNQVMRGFV